jgi:hypothetical protein
LEKGAVIWKEDSSAQNIRSHQSYVVTIKYSSSLYLHLELMFREQPSDYKVSAVQFVSSITPFNEHPINGKIFYHWINIIIKEQCMLRRMPSNLSAHVLILDMEMTTH